MALALLPCYPPCTVYSNHWISSVYSDQSCCTVTFYRTYPCIALLQKNYLHILFNWKHSKKPRHPKDLFSFTNDVIKNECKSAIESEILLDASINGPFVKSYHWVVGYMKKKTGLCHVVNKRVNLFLMYSYSRSRVFFLICFYNICIFLGLFSVHSSGRHRFVLTVATQKLLILAGHQYFAGRIFKCKLEMFLVFG